MYKKEPILDARKTKYKLKTEPLNARRFRSVGRSEFPQIKQKARKVQSTVNRNRQSNEFTTIDT